MDARFDLRTEQSRKGSFAPVSHVLLLTPIPTSLQEQVHAPGPDWTNPGPDWTDYMGKMAIQRQPWTFRGAVDEYSDNAKSNYNAFATWAATNHGKYTKLQRNAPYPENMHNLMYRPLHPD